MGALTGQHYTRSMDAQHNSPLGSSLPLARCAVDRDANGRQDPQLLEHLLMHPNTRVLLQNRDTVLVGALPEGGLALDLRVFTQLRPVTAATAPNPLYLGKTLHERINTDGRVDPVGTSVIAIEVDDFHAQQIEPNQRRWEQLTEVALELSDLDVGLFTEALALRNFHTSHRYSPRTGAPLTSTEGGWVLRDSEGGAVFPRTDTAVIVLVTDADDRILLGANRNWSPRFYSLLAGFVEPGESFEQAAAREVLEEAAAEIVELNYVGSQPWPFPASLMVGFTAKLAPHQDPATVRADEFELAEVRWFTRAEIREHPEFLPGRSSIARAMIEQWNGQPIA